MLTEELLVKFMMTPWDYTSLTLPVKLPFDKVPIQLEQLPLIGYLEEVMRIS